MNLGKRHTCPLQSNTVNLVADSDDRISNSSCIQNKPQIGLQSRDVEQKSRAPDIVKARNQPKRNTSLKTNNNIKQSSENVCPFSLFIFSHCMLYSLHTFVN